MLKPEYSYDLKRKLLKVHSITDEAGLKWKLRQIDYELQHIIPVYRKSNALINQF